jgi:hypothetical protein
MALCLLSLACLIARRFIQFRLDPFVRLIVANPITKVIEFIMSLAPYKLGVNLLATHKCINYSFSVLGLNIFNSYLQSTLLVLQNKIRKLGYTFYSMNLAPADCICISIANLCVLFTAVMVTNSVQHNYLSNSYLKPTLIVPHIETKKLIYAVHCANLTFAMCSCIFVFNLCAYFTACVVTNPVQYNHILFIDIFSRS